jgi:threonine dehydrogenase-like Zn-dependent dehydrogenase
MKACVIHAAKSLKIEERPEPRPSDGEVLVRFGAGGICGSDLRYYHEGRAGISRYVNRWCRVMKWPEKPSTSARM